MLSPVGGVALGPLAGCQPSVPAPPRPLGEEAACPRAGGSDARTEDSEEEGEAGAALVEVQSIASQVQRSVSEACSRLLEHRCRALAVQWRERDGRR